jgi:hypothetical protein
MERFMITVHIERLVLEGLPITRAQGPLVQAAVQAELSRLLAQGGLGPELAAGGAVPSVPTKGIQLGGGRPGEMGRQIARSVYGGMNR